MSDVIKIENATKVIKDRTVLDGISLELPRGGVYGFMGINGSGKTMLFRAVAGLIHLSSGSVSVFGRRIGKDCDFPPNLGLSLDSTGFWEDQSALWNLVYLASIRGEVGEPAARDALRRVGLDPDDARKVSAFSMGMRQRLSIAQAVMERPELLILDEPTNALDVDGIGMVARLISEERARGCTILVSCHNEPQVEALFDRTYHLYEGRLADGRHR